MSKKLYDAQTVVKNIYFDMIDLMEDGLDSKLTSEDILRLMVAPLSRLDYESVEKDKLKKIMVSVHLFMKRSKLRFDLYNKVGIEHTFARLWIPSLTEIEKFKMLSEFRMIKDFDDDGYVIFNETIYESYKKLKCNPYLKITYGPGLKSLGTKASSEKIGDDNHQVFTCVQDADGYFDNPMNINAEEWYEIIKDATKGIKMVLNCYTQMPDYRGSCLDIEHRFGIKANVVNSYNTALGFRARSMMGNFELIDEKDDNKNVVWSIAMCHGRWENKEFFWQLRPELAEAAIRFFKEDGYEDIKELEK